MSDQLGRPVNAPVLSARNQLFVRQVHEIAEWIGFETRNKYQITDKDRQLIAYAAEQGKGIFGFLLRQYLGHWRRFDVNFFSPNRELFLIASHPFRWFFERIEIRDASGTYLGAIQKRFSILTKRFDVENAQGQSIMEVASPIWRIWTFSFMRHGRQTAAVKKQWSGVLTELLTDKDTFLVEFNDPAMSETDRTLVMTAAVFIDLLYFEVKQ